MQTADIASYTGNAWLGVDCGSTTTKLVVISEDKTLLYQYYASNQGNPVEIAKAAIEHAKRNGNDLVFIDTAGRLHIDTELMDELKRITEAVEVHNILLVIDFMVGQDAVNIAKSFNEIL